jgi:hypothetical protein
MALGKKIEPRMTRQKRGGWKEAGQPLSSYYNIDRAIGLEIRDLLIEIEYGQRQLNGIYAAIHDLAGQIAGERKAIDTLTNVADKLATVVEGAADMVALRQWVERHGIYKELEESTS